MITLPHRRAVVEARRLAELNNLLPAALWEMVNISLPVSDAEVSSVWRARRPLEQSK